MIRDKFVEVFLTLGPLIHKKLHRIMPLGGISRQQLELLLYIFLEDGKTMKHYSERLLISKSNLTVLADKLIEEELIERFSKPTDRRAILLTITQKGKQLLERQKIQIKKELKEKIAVLSDEDVEQLNQSFLEIIRVLKKIEL